MIILKYFSFIFLLLFSCAYNSFALKENVTNELKNQGFKALEYNSGQFKLFTLQKVENLKLPIRIYIEGDGNAYLDKHTPSLDPTPRHNTLIQLIKSDNYPNIIYLARPCQYTVDKNCAEKYWTTARFNEDVINSMDYVIKKFEAKKLELIGYSGGAEIAIFLSAKNSNIISLRTIAGNLDHNAFTKQHNLTPLYESLTPSSSIREISSLPQIHFVGSKDVIINDKIFIAYKAQQLSNSCTKFFKITNATHAKGWVEQWPELLKIKAECF